MKRVLSLALLIAFVFAAGMVFAGSKAPEAEEEAAPAAVEKVE